MRHMSKHIMLTIIFSILISFPSAASVSMDFGEQAEYEEILDASDFCGLLNLPGGDSCEIFYKRSDGKGFSTVTSPDGGRCYMNLPEGYRLSYGFMVDDGEKEQYLPEGIVEPVYIQSANENSDKPGNAFLFTRNTRKGTRVMYDLPSRYEYHGSDGQVLKVQQIVTVTSMETGETAETRYPTVDVEDLEYRQPDINLYEVKQGDCLWNIAKQMCGDPFRWTAVYEANRDLIKDTDLIYPAQTLVIP